MRKEFVRCTICLERLGEECAFAVSEEGSEEEIRLYCCDVLAKKREKEYC